MSDRESGAQMNPSKERWTTETKPLLKEIRRLVRLSDLSQRQVEKQAGFSKGYLSQLLGQNLDLKVWHVFAILNVLDVEPRAFYARVFPGRTGKPASLVDFQASSEPVPDDLDRLLGRLYRDKADSIEHLRLRMERVEDALGQLESRGLLHFDRGREPED